MKIKKVYPQGFCKGVINAISMTNDSLKTAKRPIYMLGSIVHNSNITKAYSKQNVILINSLDEIKPNTGSIIITAHGVSKNKYQRIKDLGLDIIDTTCQCVKQIQDLVYEMISKNYTVIYYGKKNHAECLGIEEDYVNNPNFILIQSIKDIDSFDIKNDKIFFTNQTTMSYFDTLEIINKLKNKYPSIIIKEDICNATKRRQLAFIDSSKSTDASIVVGDKMSNNTISLVDICKKYTNKDCYLISNIDEVKNIELDKYNSLSITSGASTPPIIVNEVINKIKDDNYSSFIQDEDFINIKKVKQ